MGEWKVVFVVFGIYFAGLWITLLALGMINKCRSFTELDAEDMWLTVIWPMALVMWAVFCIFMLVMKLVFWFGSTRTGKAVGFGLALISLPFRPVALGCFLRDRLDILVQRKRFAQGRECDETMAAALAAVEKEGK